jgi:hypothetical protein
MFNKSRNYSNSLACLTGSSHKLKIECLAQNRNTEAGCMEIWQMELTTIIRQVILNTNAIQLITC